MSLKKKLKKYFFAHTDKSCWRTAAAVHEEKQQSEKEELHKSCHACLEFTDVWDRSETDSSRCAENRCAIFFAEFCAGCISGVAEITSSSEEGGNECSRLFRSCSGVGESKYRGTDSGERIGGGARHEDTSFEMGLDSERNEKIKYVYGEIVDVGKVSKYTQERDRFSHRIEEGGAACKSSADEKQNFGAPRRVEDVGEFHARISKHSEMGRVVQVPGDVAEVPETVAERASVVRNSGAQCVRFSECRETDNGADRGIDEIERGGPKMAEIFSKRCIDRSIRECRNKEQSDSMYLQRRYNDDTEGMRLSQNYLRAVQVRSKEVAGCVEGYSGLAKKNLGIDERNRKYKWNDYGKRSIKNISIRGNAGGRRFKKNSICKNEAGGWVLRTSDLAGDIKEILDRIENVENVEELMFSVGFYVQKIANKCMISRKVRNALFVGIIERIREACVFI